MRFDSVIFDLDGTLWNASENVTAAWNVILSREGRELRLKPRDVVSAMGLTMYGIADALFSTVPVPERYALMDRCCDYENEYLREHGGRLFDGVETTLDALSRTHRLFIVSNCPEGYIEAFLHAHGLGRYFEGFDCWGRTRVEKGETNRMLIERMHLRAPLYVGDTDGDSRSARHVSIPFVWARYGFGTPASYDYAVDSFPELLTIID
ncbi:MAG: HAD family hydrolase [Clostridia bacterium]|nr:HAD family hydrolase [Clostridia bacterium]